MKKQQVREVQPAHKSDRFTVAEAVRAFRQVRGNTPKPDIFDGSETTIVRRDPASGRFILADAPATITADKAESSGKRLSRPRKR
jgi:hypothetical protein